jgi:hypothetical protein
MFLQQWTVYLNKDWNFVLIYHLKNGKLFTKLNKFCTSIFLKTKTVMGGLPYIQVNKIFTAAMMSTDFGGKMNATILRAGKRKKL